MARARGTLVTWNDDRGFGFIAPDPPGRQLFAHISDFPRGNRPIKGDSVTYSVGAERDGKERAINIAWTDRHATPSGTFWAASAALAVAATLAYVTLQLATPWWIAALYLGASLITAATYVGDKRAATSGTWRVSESTLLLLGLIGGWPGALIAQQALRHKIRKPSFMTVFWITAVLNIAALGVAILYFAGRL